MEYLLDTQILIWWFEGNKRLSSDFKEVILDPKNIKYVSVVSFWEIAIKIKVKKLKLKKTIEYLARNMRFEALDVRMEHVLGFQKLPNIHKDPFDRMIIAQTKVEKLTLLTSDQTVKKYFKD